jgi:hypothetical protein
LILLRRAWISLRLVPVLFHTAWFSFRLTLKRSAEFGASAAPPHGAGKRGGPYRRKALEGCVALKPDCRVRWKKSSQAFEIAQNGDGDCAYWEGLSHLTDVRIGQIRVLKGGRDMLHVPLSGFALSAPGQGRARRRAGRLRRCRARFRATDAIGSELARPRAPRPP